MPRIEPFEKYYDQYEDWFVKNKFAFKAEIEAVRKHIPEHSRGIEIGVGSGLFAEPLGIHIGLEPSREMRTIAVKRGVDVVEGIAEHLPFMDDFYDFALMVTTICFVDDVQQSINEARRIIKAGAKLIIGLIDKNSPVGKIYRKHQQESVFYKDASFYSTDEIVGYMKKAGFQNFYFTQTIFTSPDKVGEAEQIKEGFGEGSFVVISAVNKNG
ncbi:MAG: class I SAM-dependent methyltransferase [Calditrichaceae bacterium]|nr:class I SAM-dependent methyltransferase [Calditrichaceae bacterium]